MQPWQDAPFPLRVGEAASAYRLGGLVTAAEADNRTMTRRAVLHFVGLLVFLPLLAGILVRLGGTSWLPVLAALATVAVAVHLVDRFGPRPGVMRVGRQGLHFPGLTVPWALVPVRLPRAQ